MRCKKHYTDLSSSVGVCASCLRERLFSLIAAQTKADQHRKSTADNNQQSPIIFPHSVSPYISRRKSDNFSSHHQNQQQHHNHSLSDKRFYSTPQIGPTGLYGDSDSTKKKKTYIFSHITNIFRSKTQKRESDSNSNNTDTIASTSSSWFSGILPGHRRKKQQTTTTTAAAFSGGLRIHPGYQDRGMSPAARFSVDGEEDDDECCESGYVSEKQTPVRGNYRPRQSHSRNVSGLAFCLSPLVRASPNRQRKGMPPEMAFSGEIRVSVKANVPYASAFCKNRSRKLADFGRANPNH